MSNIPMDSQHKMSAARGTMWAYVQNWAARGITFVVFFALARLLGPTEFGAFAVAMVFLTLGEIFVEQLFGHALVQRATLSPEHINAAFWTTMGCGLLLALLALTCAPLFARAFDSDGIQPVIMALSPVFLLMALSAVPAGLLRRSLDYRTLARRTATANLLSGAVAIVAALMGLGVWSFVLQQLCFHVTGTVILWRHETWRPRRAFDRRALRDLSGFSARITFVKLLDLAETRVIELVVGRQMGLALLGNYALAARAQLAATQLLAAPLWDASISVFARAQVNREALLDAIATRSLMAATFIVPAFLLAAGSGAVLVPAVFGGQWHDAVAPFQILCLLGALRTIALLYSSAVQATGAAGAMVQVGIVRCACSFLVLPLLLPFGPAGVAASLLFGQMAAVPIIFRVIRLSLEIQAMPILRQIAKPVLAAVLAAAVGFAVANFAQTRVNAVVGSALSLGISAALYALLIVALMPRVLLRHVSRLPGAVGGAGVRLLEGVVRLNDGMLVRAYRLLMSLARPFAAQPAKPGEVVIVIADAYSMIGSVGDQALVGGLTALLKQAGIKSARVLCRPGVEMPVGGDVAFSAMPLWGRLGQAGAVANELAKARALIVIGADVLDGFYSRFESKLRLEVAGFAARRGVPAMVCSFSFNDRPDPAMAGAFRQLPPGVTLLCRDAVSRERVAQLVGERVKLTADLGFLLEPSPASELERSVATWLKEGPQDGSQPRGPVIAWNLSPHSLKLLSAAQRDQAVSASATAIARLVKERDARVVLVPHDFRPHASDPEMLADVFSRLPADVQPRVLLAQGPYTAADVKQCCQHFDLVLTGRMHLMIATLGRDIPVVAVEYQGKFAGALRHFGLGAESLLSPLEVCDPDSLVSCVCARLDALAETRAQIRSRRPAVEQLASAALAAQLGA
ncbi:oligosaccharide flippase family protein [Rhizobacter sp. SG703]|uniref:oligosaccharide flippase family protein n=1 Tax=Rhizobacter sp. SG703 TaxID=2587140 RepID=UPI00144546F1|nr:oligosaccharide flippase family protein [Rhizobacter sp. SG703]NKI93050.1 O-antigen/teichoic acid export membrane protein/polysaccharide pyruvyl transferase WcaK-like protein [Rhizobacter sp. SG703]